MTATRASAQRVGVLHIHSTFSRDGRDTVAELRALAAERGISFVGLTDHAEDLDREQFEELRRECARHSDQQVQLIPGLEFRFEGYPGLHLLALGLERWIEPESPADFIRLSRAATRLTVAAHPRLFKYMLPEAVAQGIDGIEVWNASHDTRYLPDPGAIALFNTLKRRRPELVATVGLDQHDSRNDRGTRIVLAALATDPLAEVKAGRFMNRGRTMRFGARQQWGLVRLSLLRGVRAVYDRVERAQERVARARQRAARRAERGDARIAILRRRLAEAEAREDRLIGRE